MVAEGEWKDEVRADSRAARRIKLQFQGVGAHPWLLARRTGPARGICGRPTEDDRLSSWQLPSEVLWRLYTMVSSGRFSAQQMVFGSNPVD